MIGLAGLAAFLILDSPLGVLLLLGGLVIEVGELYLWMRYLRRFRVRGGVEGLIGERGEALSALSPGPAEGRARVRGELWRVRLAGDGEATGPGPVPAGAEVVVREVEGLLLTVEPTGVQLR